MQRQVLIKQFNITCEQAIVKIAGKFDHKHWISVIKKRGLTEDGFGSIMRATPKRNEEYPDIFHSRFSLRVRPCNRTARCTLGRRTP
jgi:hypothetical protein